MSNMFELSYKHLSNVDLKIVLFSSNGHAVFFLIIVIRIITFYILGVQY